MRGTPALLAAVAAGLLAGCGGGGDSGSGSGGVGTGGATGTTPGSLLQNPPALLSSKSAAELLAQLVTAAGTQNFGTLVVAQVLTLAGNPPCDVRSYHLEYNTLGGAGEATTASGALMVPSGTDAACQGARPIVLYAHGTSTDHDFNIADLTQQQNAEGILLAAFFAARGYIVVAPNYAGYDTSMLPYHPFLVAAQQSKDMIDALSAARAALTASSPVHDNGRLFITGYSQGGYVAMATQRALQAAGRPVTAAAPMSGPYALEAFVDAEFAGQVSGGAPIVATLLISGYQHSYGSVYASAADVFAPPYADGIATLLPSTMSRNQIYAAGLLPPAALFDSTPPTAADAAITPATTPTDLAVVFAQGFGSDGLITNDYRLRYLQDMTAPAPALPLRQALQLNDLRTFTPVAPTLLCGGNQDPQVFFANTQLMQSYWAANGPAPVTVLDLDAATNSGGPDGSLQTEFQQAKSTVAAAAVLQGATDNGQTAVFEAYHATLVAPFCLAAVVQFFNGQ
jgi:poly(3-hydroxybutyrate) depolymerase